MNVAIPQCSECVYFHNHDKSKNACDAFPTGDGIPNEIILGKFDHRLAHDGDHGIRFQTKLDVALQEAFGTTPADLAQLDKSTSLEAAADMEPGDRWITENGQHILIGPGGERKGGNPKAYPGGKSSKGVTKQAAPTAPTKQPTESKLDRVTRAQLAAKLCGVKQQRLADEMEAKLSQLLGVPRTGNNKPFDLQNYKLGIEIKTAISNSHDKLTMNHGAKERKEAEARAKRLRMYTVVVDKRPGNSGYYIKRGVGSFRFSTMQHIKNDQELKVAIR